MSKSLTTKVKLELNNLPVHEETPETINISISIVDENETPIPGANVRIGEITGTTGSAGGCTLQNVPVGIQTIIVTKDGYDNYSDSIIVSEEETSFNIILTEV